jgi:hypothetical protein
MSRRGDSTGSVAAAVSLAARRGLSGCEHTGLFGVRLGWR